MDLIELKSKGLKACVHVMTTIFPNICVVIGQIFFSHLVPSRLKNSHGPTSPSSIWAERVLLRTEFYCFIVQPIVASYVHWQERSQQPNTDRYSCLSEPSHMTHVYGVIQRDFYVPIRSLIISLIFTANNSSLCSLLHPLSSMLGQS